MGSVGVPAKVKLFVGMLAKDVELFGRAQEALRHVYGTVDMESDVWPFDFTDYYADEMGAPLYRKFVSFERHVDPGELANIKLATNEAEARFALRSGSGVRRPINLDPGYLTTAKLVLATTKDYAHRIYLGRGIYAEVTLRFSRGRFQPFEWTYPDYRSAEYMNFFLTVRTQYRRQLAQIRREATTRYPIDERQC